MDLQTKSVKPLSETKNVKIVPQGCDTKIYYGKMDTELDSLINYSKSIKTLPSQSVEFEIRFGKKDGDHLAVSPEVFQKLMSVLSSQKSYIHTHEERKINSSPLSDYKKVYRETITDTKTTYQIKEKKFNLIMNFFEYTLKFAVNTEIPAQKQSNLKLEEIISVRDSFKTNEVVFDLSIDTIKGKKYHRVEIEFVKYDKMIISSYIKSMLYVLVGPKFMYFITEPNGTQYVPKEVLYFQNDMYDTFDKTISQLQPKDFDIQAHSKFISANKSGDSVTPKLNGEYMNIYASPNYLFFSNKKGVIMDIVCLEKSTKTLFFEAEFFNNSFHIFDCLCLN